MTLTRPTFLKLGGSIITDKSRPFTARHDVVARYAEEIGQALEANPGLRLLLGHGSGSFGHWAAKPYGTRHGVGTPEEWRGYAAVAGAAARLNRLVTDALLEADVPVLTIQPSASARCRDGLLYHLETHPLRAGLACGLNPLVYGDVALDDVRGGTIISTEEIFVYLARELKPARILLIGRAPGVLDEEGQVIPRIRPADLPHLQDALKGSAGVDVTGGMADKVTQMVHLAQQQEAVTIHILSCDSPGDLTRALLDPTIEIGTRIVAQSAG